MNVLDSFRVASRAAAGSGFTVRLASSALMLSALLAAPSMAQPSTGAIAPERVEELVALLGYGSAQLEGIESTAVTLLDGRRLELLKALDPATGRIVGGTFDSGVAVDLRAAQRDAARSWRARHGALTPRLRARLDTLGVDEMVDVVAWLEVDLSTLTERAPVGPTRRESGTGSGAAAPAEGAPEQTAGRTEPEIEKPGSATPPPRPESELAARREELESLRARDNEHRAAVRAALAPARAAFLARAAQAGVGVEHASESAPLAYFSAPRRLVEQMAGWPGIDALYDGSARGGPSLFYARPTQNVTPVNAAGYDGSGVAVSITEGERAFFANPYLALTDAFDVVPPYQSHPTAVSGIVRSTHAEEHGLASGVNLYSANGSYSVEATMSAAMDWGSVQAEVLNNSFYWDAPNNPSFLAMDRHQDWLVRWNWDTVVVAAGNYGNSCGGAFSPFVVSPAKGYNVVSVGNFDDLDTIGWSNDVMDVCSSFGDPTGPAGGPLAKPEMAAVGSGIWSTLAESDPDSAVGFVGSGTSYAAPMVTATVADLIAINTALGSEPEAVKAILMATAVHNIEGDARFSAKDGAGGLVGAAAAVTAERGDWSDHSVGSTTTFPITRTLYAYKGERVRFAIAWLANPNDTYTTDPLPADLDLTAYRADGTTAVASSTSGFNSFEIVEFVAPATETYQFRISKFSADWSSGGTWLGTAGWRGEFRIEPEVGYLEPEARPTGSHLAVHPTDWSPSNYWRAVGIRGIGSDHDLELANRSLFEDPSGRVIEASSFYGVEDVDLVVVDGNHWFASSPEHYRVTRWSGTGGYNLSFSNLGLAEMAGSETITHGPIVMDSAEVVEVLDFYVPGSTYGRVRVVPIGGSADLGLRIFRSNGGDPSSWTQGRSQAVVARDRSASGTATERLGVFNDGAVDYFGLVIEKKTTGAVSFNVVFLPATLFADDFEGGDLLDWSSKVP